MPHLDEGTLTALFDGELARDERDAAERHLADCGECRRLYEEIRAFAGEAGALVDSLQPERLPLPGTSRGAARPSWDRLRPLAWAATLVLAAGLGWSASTMRFSRSAGSGGPEPAGLTVPTMSAVPDPKSAGEPPADERERAGARPDAASRHLLTDLPAPATAGAAKAASAAPSVETDQVVANQAARAESAAPGAPAVGQVNALPRQARAAEALAARDAAAPAEAFRDAPLEEAVRVLGGTVKLIDGMDPARVQLGPPERGNGAVALVRITYLDPPGRELWLDQQRSSSPAEGRAAPAPAGGLLAGDTVVSAAGGGQSRVRWITADGFRLTLTGYLPGDSLRALVRRVR